MALNGNNHSGPSPRQEPALAVRRRSRRVELVIAAIALAIVVVFALTHREQVDKPLLDAQAATGASPATH